MTLKDLGTLGRLRESRNTKSDNQAAHDYFEDEELVFENFDGTGVPKYRLLCNSAKPLK